MPSFRTRLRRLYGELKYAQSRSFELRTGVPLTGPSELRRRQRREIDALNAAWQGDRVS